MSDTKDGGYVYEYPKRKRSKISQDTGERWEIIDSKTLRRVGSEYKSRWRAVRCADRLDLRYGAVRYIVRRVGGYPAVAVSSESAPQVREARPVVARVVDVDLFANMGRVTVEGKMSDGARVVLFSYYVDELTFSVRELVGLTVEEAQALHYKRDVQYLRS